MTIDTLTVLKASAAETSGTDGAGAALDLGGDWGQIFAVVTVSEVRGTSTPTALDLVFEGSRDLVNWYPVAKAPQLKSTGQYRFPIFGVESVDHTPTCTPLFLFRERPRYLRSNSVVTAGTGGATPDSVTYSVHLTA
jgi:hypothetical protein